MDPDSFQKAWQCQSSQTRVTIAADLLRNEVQRSEQNFRARIFGRDFRELAIGLVMLPLWFYLGHSYSLPWTWWLGIPAITWVCLFIVVDRIRHQQRPGEPLLDCVNSSLAQVEHQIWLLRNVFWWYLLPCTIAVLAFFAQVAWQRSPAIWMFALALAPGAMFLFLLYGFVYYLNQLAVRRDLEPRRQELLTLRASLGDETAGEHVPATNLDDVKSPGVLRQALFVAALTAVAVTLMFLADSLVPYSEYRPFPSNRGTPAPFARLITDLRREKKLVGLAALVAVDGKVVATAVDGERKWASGVPVEIGDEWHLGGITASITATMIARLIESGQLQWSTTIGECFPDAPIHDDWKSVTFQGLLTHTSGAPPLFSSEVNSERPALGLESTNARREAVLNVLAKKPDNPPGEKYAYSNVGYTIAAAMAEKKTGVTWEDLVKQEVFEPLALTSAGFGPPKSPDTTLSQPRGHRPYLGAKIPVSDEADNSPIMGPAGSVHMTLADLVTYATEHLRGHLGQGKLLSAETYQRLHAPRLNDYAYGWGVKEHGATTRQTIYWHNGSNTLWYALVVFIPDQNMVVAIAANDGDFPTAEAAAWEIVKSSVKQFDVGAKPRQPSEQSPGMRGAVPIEDAALFRTRIDEFLNAARIKAGFSGAVIVARGGKPVYEGAFGFSHLDSQAPNTLDTPFRIASLSKQFTAAAIFRLEGQGKLRIDEPVHQYLPEFAEAPYRDITIHHLLTHTSGLPRTPASLTGKLRWNAMSQAATPVEDYVRLAIETPLEFEPGAENQYSNFGYRCLAALIARVTGREYADFMEEEIFRPLGMDDTGVARVTRPPSEARIAEGLVRWKLPFDSQPRFANGENGRNFGAGYGSGGIYTSANDLVRWDRVLAADEFLTESQKARLFQPIHDNYACGWIVKKSGLDGRLYQMHNGGNEGFFSRMMRLPEDDLVIIAVGNVDATPALNEVLEQLFRLCRSLPYSELQTSGRSAVNLSGMIEDLMGFDSRSQK